MNSRFATAARIHSVARETLEIDLELDAPLSFTAGQFVMLVIPGPGRGDVRAFSIYSAPDDDRRLVLLVRLLAGGKAGEYLRGLREGERVELRGPFGRFVLTDGAGPIRMIATGTGLVPFRSMLEVAARNADGRSFRLLNGAREAADLFGLEHLDRLRAQLPDLTVTTTLTRPVAGWSGAEGRVHEAGVERPPEAEGQYYLCGNGEMIRAIRGRLAARGIPKAAIHVERFD